MHIGIDIDEVLADFVQGFLVYHNSLYGTRVRREDLWTYDLWKVLDVSYDVLMQRIWEFYDSPAFAALKPVWGAKTAVRSLARDHHLHVITNRPVEIQERTRSWLHKHFPQQFASVAFGNLFSEKGKRIAKATLCRRLRVAVMIEDDPRQAMLIARRGIRVVLLDKPWNQKCDLPRVRQWHELHGMLGSSSSCASS